MQPSRRGANTQPSVTDEARLARARAQRSRAAVAAASAAASASSSGPKRSARVDPRLVPTRHWRAAPQLEGGGVSQSRWQRGDETAPENGSSSEDAGESESEDEVLEPLESAAPADDVQTSKRPQLTRNLSERWEARKAERVAAAAESTGSAFFASWAPRAGHRPAPVLKQPPLQEAARATQWKSSKRREAAQLAAKEFDERQRKDKASASRALKETKSRPDDPQANRVFKRHCKDLFRNRFYVPEKPAPSPKRFAATAAPPPPPKPGWNIDDSIWGGRSSYFDSEKTIRKAVGCDFEKAIGQGNLEKFLLKNDANAPDPDNKEQVKEFMQECEDVFFSYGSLFFMIFDYFASIGGSDDLFHINRTAYDSMIQQCGLQVKGSKHCDLAHLDLIFVQVNAPKPTQNSKLGVKKSVAHDSKHALTRAELIQCLTRIAVARFVLTPKTPKTPNAGKTDVSDAIDELFKVIRHSAPREVLQDGSAFRSMSCYKETVDMALRLYEPALRLLFAKYSAGEGMGGKDGDGARQMARGNSLVADSDKMLSPGEWVCLCRELAP